MSERIADLTVDDFKALICQTACEIIAEIDWEDSDFEEDAPFKPAVAEYLREARRAKRRSTPSDEVIRKLGLEAWMSTPSFMILDFRSFHA